MELKQFENQDREELSLIEVAHAIIEEHGDIIDFTELLVRVQQYLGLSEKYIEERMIIFYTDLNTEMSGCTAVSCFLSGSSHKARHFLMLATV